VQKQKMILFLFFCPYFHEIKTRFKFFQYFDNYSSFHYSITPILRHSSCNSPLLIVCCRKIQQGCRKIQHFFNYLIIHNNSINLN
jgi:hypothetical protein